MVRESTLRLKKWDKKIDPAIVLQRFSALKDISEEQLDPYLIQVTGYEKRVKEFLEAKGITPTLIAFYLAYARELLGKTFGSISSETLRNEELAIRSKWVNRGLEDSNLQEIAKMFGIDPKPLPIPVEVFKIFNDIETTEDLAKLNVFVPSGIAYELSTEKAYNGTHSLKIYSINGSDMDFRSYPFEQLPSLTFDIDLSKYKEIQFRLWTDTSGYINVYVVGYDKDNNIIFGQNYDIGFLGDIGFITQYWGYLHFSKEAFVNFYGLDPSLWDLCVKLKIMIWGSFSNRIYIDTFMGRLV